MTHLKITLRGNSLRDLISKIGGSAHQLIPQTAFHLLFHHLLCVYPTTNATSQRKIRSFINRKLQNKWLLYFVDRASRYEFLLITNLTHFFMYLFLSSLYMFRASQCSSSGVRIVLIHHLVCLVCVSDCLECRSGGNYHSTHHQEIELY